jgi:SHAQKYF class myb-like DNA-binding protein
MTISKRVQKELVQAVPPSDVAAMRALTGRIPKQQPKSKAPGKSARVTTAALAEASKGKAWTREEHERFLVALDLFPSGPWKAIADYVGSKNSRQTMTHAQKYRQKHERRQRGLRNKTSSKKTKAKTKAKARASVKIESDDGDDAMDGEDLSPRSVSAGATVESPAGSDGDSSSAFEDAPAVMAVGEDGAAPPDWNLLFKQASVTEIFPEFEPVDFMPEMWSTNSLEEMVLGGHGGRFDLLFSGESHTAVV